MHIESSKQLGNLCVNETNMKSLKIMLLKLDREFPITIGKIASEVATDDR
jgi:hypothetical protein